jgi:hypothetical protein
MALEVAEVAPYPTLQRRLNELYAGRTMTFLDLLNEDYPGGPWVEREYRAAVKAMARPPQPSVRITRTHPKTKTGRAARGLQPADTVTFR